MQEPKAPQIGPIIQRHRKRAGLSLNQLATLSSVSRSMLSQIERGESNPTFAVLWALTRALKIDFSDLMGDRDAKADENPIDIVPVAQTPEILSADGSCTLRILSPPAFAGAVEWYDVEIKPSGILDSAPHAAGTAEHFTAFSPGFVVTSGGATRSLQTGETARYPADVPHRIVNNSRKRAKGLMVVLYAGRRKRS